LRDRRRDVAVPALHDGRTLEDGLRGRLRVVPGHQGLLRRRQGCRLIEQPLVGRIGIGAEQVEGRAEDLARAVEHGDLPSVLRVAEHLQVFLGAAIRSRRTAKPSVPKQKIAVYLVPSVPGS
jgi:hypothetical protein